MRHLLDIGIHAENVEAARQATIAQMRDKHMLPPAGLGAPPANFKYAVIHFSPESLIAGHPGSEMWGISHIEFDQLKECMNVFENSGVRVEIRSSDVLS
jgi:hypothetical protein